MKVYNRHDISSHDGPVEVTMATRVTEAERDAMRRLARLHDRTPSRELRRAIRFYLTHFEIADQALDGPLEPEYLP